MVSNLYWSKLLTEGYILYFYGKTKKHTCINTAILIPKTLPMPTYVTQLRKIFLSHYFDDMVITPLEIFYQMEFDFLTFSGGQQMWCEVWNQPRQYFLLWVLIFSKEMCPDEKQYPSVLD